MKNKQKIVVFGGTGNYGRKIVGHLLQNGHQVKVVSRNVTNAKRILGEKVEFVEGDVTDPTVIHKALEEVDRIIICLSAINRKLIRKMKEIEYNATLNIIEEAKRANINRLVYLSVYSIRMDVLKKLGMPEFGKLKLEVENKIKASGLNWTVLGCAPMQELFFTFIRKGKMAVPGGGNAAIPSVSDEDVGEIAAQAIIRNDLNGKRFKLCGPRAYTFPEVAGMVSQELGTTIKHITIPLFVINLVSTILFPIIPFVRYIYKSLILLNNFPEDERDVIADNHQLLRNVFDYEPVTLEQEIHNRIAQGKIQYQ